MNYLDAKVSVPIKLLETLEQIAAEHLTSFYIRGVQPNWKDAQAKQELSKLLVEAGRKLNVSPK